jgi:hypothetical protein
MIQYLPGSGDRESISWNSEQKVSKHSGSRGGTARLIARSDEPDELVDCEQAA